MPAQAGIQGSRWVGNTQSLDSGFRRKDENEKVDFKSTPTNPSAYSHGLIDWAPIAIDRESEAVAAAYGNSVIHAKNR